MINYNARLYDPALGRFLSVDPMIAHPGSTQAINPYSYVENNPLNKTDPTGMASAEPTCTGSGENRVCTPDSQQGQKQNPSSGSGKQSGDAAACKHPLFKMTVTGKRINLGQQMKQTISDELAHTSVKSANANFSVVKWEMGTQPFMSGTYGQPL